MVLIVSGIKQFVNQVFKGIQPRYRYEVNIFLIDSTIQKRPQKKADKNDLGHIFLIVKKKILNDQLWAN